MEQAYQGMTVTDASGPIGTVSAVERDPISGAYLLQVQRTDGTRLTLAHGMYRIVGDVVQIDQTGGIHATINQTDHPTYPSTVTQEADTMAGQRLEATDELVIPVVEEEAVVRTRQVERGGVRVHKRVNEREEVVEQPTMHEDVDVERVPIGRIVEVAPTPRQEGDTLIVPVLEEMLVVEKRLVLKEEVRITRRRTESIEEARVVLREEDVVIEPLSERGSGEPLP